MKSRSRRVVGGFVLALVGLVVVLLLRPRPPRLYQATILPSLGGNHTTAYAINDRGQVAGVSRLANGDEHLFLRDRYGGMQDLGPVVESTIIINNRGQIGGMMRDPNDNNRAFVWDPNAGRRMLPTLGGKDIKLWAMNDLGQVVGHAYTAAGDCHAFLWDTANSILDLSPRSTQPAGAFSINDAGQIVVFSASGSSVLATEAGRISSSVTLPLHAASGINSTGAVAGVVQGAGKGFNVVIWRPDSGVIETIARATGGFPGAQKINDAGQVLFWRGPKTRFKLFGRSFWRVPFTNYLWDPQRGAIRLDDCLPLGPGDELRINALNSRGALVGVVHRRNGRSEAILLEPIPERWGP